MQVVFYILDTSVLHKKLRIGCRNVY